MNYFNNLSLKNKIFITCLGFVILVSILIGVFTRSLLIASLTGELKKRGIGIAQGVADASRVFILTNNRAELTALAYDARLGNRKDIVRYLVISNDKGEILAHTFTTGYPPVIEQTVKEEVKDQPGIISIDLNRYQVFHVSVPVKEGIYTIGSVQIGLDKQHIDKLISNLRLVFLSFLSTVTVLFFFLSHRLALQITKPIAALIRYTDQLTKGDFNIVSTQSPEKTGLRPGSNDDEITKLTNSFLKMTSQLKQSTERLTESQEKYRSLFKSGPNPIFVVNKKTFEILDANPNATYLFGYTRKELTGMNLFDLAGSGDERFIDPYPENETMVTRSKVRFVKKGGDEVFVNIHASPSEYRNEDVIIVAATDITELVEKDTQLIQASKMTNLEKMSAGIAHEINQPLNAIKMGSEYLNMMNEKKQPVKEADLKLVLCEISTQVSRAAEIVGRLKTFSHKADFSREVIDVNLCIRSVGKIIGRQIALQNIDLQLDLDENIPRIMAHNNRMEQVVFNLITNARDAINERIETQKDIEKGKITISTFSDGRSVGFTLADNGTGIEPDQKKRIFESFYTTKAMGEGLGLGLPIIHGIVRDYNGTISVSSTPGEGASFRLMFPACREDLQHKISQLGNRK
jgi:PAS domain S-box-containing protein